MMRPDTNSWKPYIHKPRPEEGNTDVDKDMTDTETD